MSASNRDSPVLASTLLNTKYINLVEKASIYTLPGKKQQTSLRLYANQISF